MSAPGTPSPPLIRTKLLAPVARETIERPSAVQPLVRGGARLALVRAPAGWGKSSLLVSWAAQDARRFAWVALDRLDDQPVRFFTYVIAALQTLAPEVGERSLPVLAGDGDLVEEVVPVLVEELGALPGPSVLALDDYHLVSDEAIHEGLAFLIDHAPPELSFAIGSRSEPPLPLARLRGRGELLEVTADQLRFGPKEADALLRERQGVELDPEDVARLVERTEGWPAGLYLAGLSLRDRPDAARAVDRFAGDDRHVVDYLTSEVLAGQPDGIRDFLLATCILDRLSAPLCDAVTGRTDSAELLRRIERSNLFLVPLDQRREWYRYHHLFADLLALESHGRHRGEEHRRAAAWLQEAGEIAPAIHHLVAAGDVAAAGELIASHWLPTVTSGRHHDVEAWYRALPEEAIRADARLCVGRAMTLISVGDLRAVDPWIQAAERAPALGPFADGFGSGEAGAAYLRAVHRWQTGDASGTLAAAQAALAAERDPSPWDAVTLTMLAGATYWLGERERGEALAQEALAACRAVGFRPPELSSLAMLGVIELERGDGHAARAHAMAALGIAAEGGVEEYWIAAAPHTVLGRLALAEGRAEEGRAELERGVELARRGVGPLGLANALLPLALALDADGDAESAAALLAEARTLIEEAPDPGPVTLGALADARRRLDGRRGSAVEPGEFSERELQVLRMLAGPLTAREIGQELFISFNTVKSHTKAIYRKLGAADRREALARARELGVL